MKKVTIWERLNDKSGRWEHNHMVDGHSHDNEAPTASNALQKRSWSGATWRATAAHIDDNNVVIHD